MQYRQVPKNGDHLSALGFGAMRLPSKRMRIDENRAARQIRDAVDRGINYIDTAVPYHGGESERFLGRALADGYRAKVKLATKLPPYAVQTRQDMNKILDIQLKKLRTDCIDYYLLHALDASNWKKLCGLGVREFLDAAKQAGKIRNAGFSFHGDRKAFKEIVDAYDWACCMIQYNFLDEMNQAGTEGLEYAAAKRLAIIVMEPLRGGMLANKLPPRALDIYRRSTTQRTPAQWAFRWIWNRPEVTVVLSGMNDERQITENLQTCAQSPPGCMSAPELAIIQEVAALYRRTIKIGCTGCAYCMPCPSGVNIPNCLAAYNEYHMGTGKVRARAVYAGMLMGTVSGIKADASLCVDCGKCAKSCPQSLAIPQELEKVNRTLGGWRTKLLIPVIKMIFRKNVRE